MIEEDTEEGKSRYQITIKMKFYKSDVITRLTYDPNEGPVGTYSAKSYKLLSSTNEEFVLGKEELMSLKFTRHLQKDLYNLFLQNNFTDQLDLYKDILKKFEEIHAITYEKNYEGIKLDKKIDIMNGDKILAVKLSDDRKVSVSALSKKSGQPNVCEFYYNEKNGFVEIRFKDAAASDLSVYKFKLDDFDLETVYNYITMIVSTSFNYGTLLSK